MDTVGNDAHGVALVFEAVPMYALFLHRSDQALHHPVLLRAVRGDELLLQRVAANRARLDATDEHQSVVRSQQEGPRHLEQNAIAGDQALL